MSNSRSLAAAKLYVCNFLEPQLQKRESQLDEPSLTTTTGSYACVCFDSHAD